MSHAFYKFIKYSNSLQEKLQNGYENVAQLSSLVDTCHSEWST